MIQLRFDDHHFYTFQEICEGWYFVKCKFSSLEPFISIHLTSNIFDLHMGTIDGTADDIDLSEMVKPLCMHLKEVIESWNHLSKNSKGEAMDKAVRMMSIMRVGFSNVMNDKKYYIENYKRRALYMEAMKPIPTIVHFLEKLCQGVRVEYEMYTKNGVQMAEYVPVDEYSSINGGMNKMVYEKTVANNNITITIKNPKSDE